MLDIKTLVKSGGWSPSTRVLVAEIMRLQAALKPFADSVYNDNGEMTITYRHGPEAYYAAYWAMRGIS